MIESTTFALSSIRTSLAWSSAVHPTGPAAGGCLKGQHAQVEACMVRRRVSSHGRWQAAWRTAVDPSLLSPVLALAIWRVLVSRSHSAFVTTDASAAAHTGSDRQGFGSWQRSPVLTYVSTYLAWFSQSLLSPPWRPWHHDRGSGPCLRPRYTLRALAKLVCHGASFVRECVSRAAR